MSKAPRLVRTDGGDYRWVYDTPRPRWGYFLAYLVGVGVGFLLGRVL